MNRTTIAARRLRHSVMRGYAAALLALAGALSLGQGCPPAQSPSNEPGPAGLACWDLNGNGTGDADEDVNGDGAFDARDCQSLARVYGDGSAGAITITQDTLWTANGGSPPANNNTQFTDFTVSEGVTLTVPSGVTIRCTGTFTNNGTILVSTGAVGALVDGDASSNPADVQSNNYRQPGAGISLCPPSPGEYATPAGAPPESGFGGCGIEQPLVAAFILNPGPAGGGGGAASATGTLLGVGGDGGGTLVVRARGAIVNTGVIRADGDRGQGFGCGGGGGGILILASAKSITSNASTALLSASGGAGGESSTTRGPGGGGGGGIVHLIAPAIAVDKVEVAAGFGGEKVGDINSNPHQGGAGGGASFGSGGEGGSGTLNIPGPPGTAGPAGSGILLQTQLDPAGLF